MLLGVALAFSVHLINQSALGEFSAAVRAVNGEPDFELRGQRDGFDEALYERVARHPRVAVASPVIEIDTLRARRRRAERVRAAASLGIDALVAGAARAGAAAARRPPARTACALLDPDAIFLNAAGPQRLGAQRRRTLRVQTPRGRVELRVARRHRRRRRRRSR